MKIKEKNSSVMRRRKISMMRFCMLTVAFWFHGISIGFADNALLTPYPSHLVLQRCDLFWTEASETPVNRISLQGRETARLVNKMGVPENFIVHGGNIFWIDQRSGISPSGNCTGPGTIWILNKTSLDDLTSTRLGTADNCGGGTADIVVDDQNVFWVKSKTSPESYAIERISYADGAATTLATVSSPVAALAGDGDFIYWAENKFPDPDVGSAIRRMPKAGGQIQTIASGLKRLRNTLEVHNAEIYFADSNEFNTYRMMKTSVNGGLITTLAEVVKGAFDPVNYVIALAVDDTRVYWADMSHLNSVPVVGGSIIPLASIVNTPLDIYIGQERIFWSETTGPAHGETGSIKSILKTGEETTLWVQGGDAPRKLALDDDSLYWSEGGPIGDIEGFGRIARIAISEGPIETLVAGISVDNPPIAVDDNAVYVADKFRIKKIPIAGGVPVTLASAYNAVGGLATDGAYVYWADGAFSTIHKVPVSGGAVNVLSGVLSGPSGPVRLYGNNVYWMTNFSSINKASIFGGEAPVTIAGNLPFLDDFVVSENQIYFSEHDTGNIRKISISGGTPSTLVSLSRFSTPRSLSVFDQEVYWVDQSDVGKVGINGGAPYFYSHEVVSDASFQNSIAVSEMGLFWTDGEAALIIEHPFNMADADRDCVSDSQDAFPNNPGEWEDTDSDGIGNNADPDDDSDGMPDDWELRYGLYPFIDDASGDKDFDGYANLEEFIGGTNPDDPSSKPFKKGDLNWNDTVDLSDCILALKVLAVSGAGETVYIGADVNSDGHIGMEEVVYILQKIAGR